MYRLTSQNETSHSRRPHPFKATKNLIKNGQRRTLQAGRRTGRRVEWLAADDRAILETSDSVLRQQAVLEARQGNYSASIALFNQLLKRHPESATDYNNRGLAYFQNGQLDESILDYNRALELNPNLASAYNNRANYYAAQGQFLEAILDYDTALDLNPTNSRAWINQGITFRDLKLYERAIESFDMALELKQLEGHVYAERGRTYHLRGDWNCAVADYQRALNALPTPESYPLLSPANPSVKLRHQVNQWLDSLLQPLFS